MTDKKNDNDVFDAEALDTEGALQDVLHVEGMYNNWFLDYASYVILDRAVPNIEDGLKPVQRRILHAMNELEDGRFNKAANIIGHTMRYHPHGDAAIGDALVKVAQKNLLIETQGNWGNPVTGDPAAASRYIEARLTPFAQHILFNKNTTKWQLSYDGRNKEPTALPVKFPLLLCHGADGIAVGLSTKILSHNFVEIIKGAIAILKGRKPKILPDFSSGGIADFSEYNDGKRGGKVRVRAVINALDQKTLKITQIPSATTTLSIIESILGANEKGKIKIKQVEDNTAKDVEIVIHLPPGITTEQAIVGLYAFTDCEVSIGVNCCVIKDEKPLFCGVSDVLRFSVENTVSLLKRELDIKLNELNQKLFFATLEKLFIENRIYRKIEKCATWEAVINTILKELKPYQGSLKREITSDDAVMLTDIKIKKISKYDFDLATKAITGLKRQLTKVRYNLKNLTDYAISYYEDLLEKYQQGNHRKTQIDTFTTVLAAKVALSTEKLYVNRKEGFIGVGLKKDEYVCDCSSLDEVIVFRADGKFMVTKVAPKTFVGKNIIYISIFTRNDERRIYHLLYLDGKGGPCYAKRFNILSVIREKEYDLTKGNKGSKLLYFSVNPDGEEESVKIMLTPKPKLKRTNIKYDFSTTPIKTRTAVGNLITKHAVKKVMQLHRGGSTLEALKIWVDRSTGHLNHEEHGEYLGEFSGDDKIVVIKEIGTCELTDYSVSNYYGEDILEICRYEPNMVATIVYFEGERGATYIKSFEIDEETFQKRQEFITPHPKTTILLATLDHNPVIEVSYKRSGKKPAATEVIEVAEFTDVKGFKALGKRLDTRKISGVELLEE